MFSYFRLGLFFLFAELYITYNNIIGERKSDRKTAKRQL